VYDHVRLSDLVARKRDSSCLLINGIVRLIAAHMEVEEIAAVRRTCRAWAIHMLPVLHDVFLETLDLGYPGVDISMRSMPAALTTMTNPVYQQHIDKMVGSGQMRAGLYDEVKNAADLMFPNFADETAFIGHPEVKPKAMTRYGSWAIRLGRWYGMHCGICHIQYIDDKAEFDYEVVFAGARTRNPPCNQSGVTTSPIPETSHVCDTCVRQSLERVDTVLVHGTNLGHVLPYRVFKGLSRSHNDRTALYMWKRDSTHVRGQAHFEQDCQRRNDRFIENKMLDAFEAADQVVKQQKEAERKRKASEQRKLKNAQRKEAEAKLPESERKALEEKKKAANKAAYKRRKEKRETDALKDELRWLEADMTEDIESIRQRYDAWNSSQL